MNSERKKIEFLTNAVSGFRGLPMMYFGFSMTVLMIINYRAELNAQVSGGKDLTLSFLAAMCFLIVYIVGYPKFRNYFGEKYGYAKAKPKEFKFRSSNFIYLLPLLFQFLVGDSIDSLWGLPFNTTIFSLALFVLILWWKIYCGISNNLLYFSAILGVAMFLPWERVFFAITFKDDFWARASFYRTIGSILMGVTYFLIGFTDYQALKTMLKPIEREEKTYESF